MTYQEALAKAQRGEADQQVLGVFQSAYEEAKRGSDAQLMNERKTNLAALLLDIANKIGDAGLACFTLRCMSDARAPAVTPFHCAPDTWTAMYLEAEKLSEEVLEVYPRDEAAQSNALAARNSMTLRSHSVGRVVPEVTARSSPVCAASALPALPWAAMINNFLNTHQTQRGERVSAVVQGARSFYDEEAEDEAEDDQDGDQDGDDDDDDDDGHHMPLPTKATANAGSPGSGGTAAAPAKSLRDDVYCPRGVAA